MTTLLLFTSTSFPLLCDANPTCLRHGGAGVGSGGWQACEKGNGEKDTKRGKEMRERGERGGLYVFSSKCEAGLKGDRLCLLLSCHAVNRESRVELGCQRDSTSQSAKLVERGWGGCKETSNRNTVLRLTPRRTRDFIQEILIIISSSSLLHVICDSPIFFCYLSHLLISHL